MANTNANTNATHKLEDEIRSQKRVYSQLIESRKRTCNHKPNNHGQLINVHDSKLNIPGKKDLPDSTLVCTRCEKHFDGGIFSAGEIDSALYMLTSMAEQVKYHSNLSEEDKSTLEEYYESLDRIGSFATYYLNMVEKLSNGNNGKKAKARSSKGHMGVSSQMFNGRGY